MKLKQSLFKNVRRTQALVPVLVVGVLMLTGAVIYNFNARAATAGFYFTSSATSYKVGDNFTVGIYENSGTGCANVVQADFSYPSNLLQVQSVSATGSKFESTATSNSSAGNQSVVQYTTRKECGAAATSGIAGDQLIATMNLKVIAAGTATLAFKSSSIVVSAADNKTNVAPTSSNRTFTLAQASVQRVRRHRPRRKLRRLHLPQRQRVRRPPPRPRHRRNVP